MSSSLLGRTIGNYVVQRKLGEGGMGVVYLAEHPSIGRKVAVKVLLPELSRDPELVARFHTEARSAAEIKHENIIDVIDYGEVDGGSYIVMEWLDGTSLARALAEAGRFPLARAVHVARGIGRALAAAHAHGIVHRDLKPDNIFLVRRDEDPDFVKVLDFGIAKLLVPRGDSFKTQSGAIIGTPYYMSPEQCVGGDVDARTDVYALGVILYELLTGRLPFEGRTLGELVAAHLSRSPPSPRSFDPTIPLAVEQAVMQALEKDPERRFHQVDALVTAFAHVLSPASGAAIASVADTVPAVAAPAVLSPPTTTTTPPPSPSLNRTVAEVFLRVGIRGRKSILAVAGLATAAVLALVLLLALRGRAGQVATLPSPAAVTGPATVTHWVLQSSSCPKGAVPRNVDVTTRGNSVVSRADGTEVSGTVDPDGSFVLRGPLGFCQGRTVGDVTHETCTNLAGGSCRLTYRRVK